MPTPAAEPRFDSPGVMCPPLFTPLCTPSLPKIYWILHSAYQVEVCVEKALSYF